MRGGKIMIVGTVPGDSAINFLKMDPRSHYPDGYFAMPIVIRSPQIEAIYLGRFDVKSMVTHIYRYRDVQQAFEESVNNKHRHY